MKASVQDTYTREVPGAAASAGWRDRPAMDTVPDVQVGVNKNPLSFLSSLSLTKRAEFTKTFMERNFLYPVYPVYNLKPPADRPATHSEICSKQLPPFR